MADKRRIQGLASQVQTTDASTATALSFTLPDNSILMIEAIVCAKSGSTHKLWRVTAGVRRTSGGSATLIGASTDMISPLGDVGAATWAAAVDVNGNDARVRVTGALITTVDWFTVLNAWLFVP